MSSNRFDLRGILPAFARRHLSQPLSINERSIKNVPLLDLEQALGPRKEDRATRDWIERMASHYLGPNVDQGLINELESKSLTIGQVEGALLAHQNHKLSGPIVSRYDRNVGDRVRFASYSRLIYIPAAKVVFCPIGKVANTAVKGWAIELSGRQLESEGGIHRRVDQKEVPLQVEAWTRWRFDQVCQDPDWAFVALVRDPALRLISAYWEKFVIFRSRENTLQHTRVVLEYVYGKEDLQDKDIDEGISFRQFCQYLNAASRQEVDSHWAPQYLYLENFHWDHLFNIDRVEDFEGFVTRRCAPEYRGIPLSMRNSVSKGDDNMKKVEPLVDALPNALLSMSAKRPSANAFLTPEIERFISHYYALDYVLVNAADRTPHLINWLQLLKADKTPAFSK